MLVSGSGKGLLSLHSLSAMILHTFVLMLPSVFVASAFLHVGVPHHQFKGGLVVDKDFLHASSFQPLQHQHRLFSGYKTHHNILFATIHASAESIDDTTDVDDAEEDEVVKGVTLKMAFDSSDVWGVADLSETKSERFTSPESLDMVHRLRRESDAVLVGRGTVERDDCSLTVRRVELGDGKNQPVRVVVDPTLSISGGEYTLLNDELPTIVYHLDYERSKASPSDYVTFVGLKPSTYADGSRSSISPSQIIKDLKSRGLKHVMVEGGPATARSFLEARIVDRAILVRAPIEFQIPVSAEMDANTLKRAGLQLIGTEVMGGDNVEYWTQGGLPWPKSELSMWP